ncbi:MAG: Flp pilus assembly protein CpaB [Planctomycetia bacterium]
MRPQTLIMLVIAVLCGVGAMLAARNMNNKDGTSGDKVTVVVASAPISAGSELNDTVLRTVEYPKELVPAKAVTKLETALKRSTRIAMEPDQVLLESSLAPKGTIGIGSVIEKGKRAVAIGISTDKAVAGFIKPNDRVDILADLPAEGISIRTSRIIMQDVRILAVDSSMQAGSEDPGKKDQVVETVTFLLSPEDAERIILARNMGPLSLILRSNQDDAAVETAGATIQDLSKNTKETRSKDPDVLRLDPAVAKEENKKAGDLFAMLTKSLIEAAKPPEKLAVSEQAEAIEKTAAATKSVEVSLVEGKKRKKLVYRDLMGAPVFEVVLEADDKLAEGLGDLLEEHPGKMVEETNEEVVTPKKKAPAPKTKEEVDAPK